MLAIDANGIVMIIGAASLAIIQIITAWRASVERAEVKTALVATAAEVKLDRVLNDKKIEAIASVGEKIHVLVNSNYGASLLVSLNALKAVARLTLDPEAKKDAEAAAVEAERLYQEHLIKQAVSDSKK